MWISSASSPNYPRLENRRTARKTYVTQVMLSSVWSRLLEARDTLCLSASVSANAENPIADLFSVLFVFFFSSRVGLIVLLLPPSFPSVYPSKLVSSVFCSLRRPLVLVWLQSYRVHRVLFYFSVRPGCVRKRRSFIECCVQMLWEGYVAIPIRSVDSLENSVVACFAPALESKYLLTLKPSDPQEHGALLFNLYEVSRPWLQIRYSYRLAAAGFVHAGLYPRSRATVRCM